jgi:hypothetical protein
MTTVIAVLAFVAVGLGAVFSMMIVREVSERGIKIHYVLLRLYLFKYISQYRELTQKETGEIGPLYYPCVMSYFAALVFGIVFVIMRLAARL